MILKKGQTLTVSILNTIFRTLKRAVNEITSVQINVLTTGQIVDSGKFYDPATYGSTYTITVTPMSVSNEQFFDTTFVPGYYTGIDGTTLRGHLSYLNFYIDEIDKINSME